MQKESMLVPREVASEFLEKYKLLLTLVNNGVKPKNAEAYASIRNLIYEEEFLIELFEETLGEEFLDCVQNAVFGRFLFLKAYKNGYAFCSLADERYYLCKALTSPLDELIGDYSVVRMAMISFQGYLFCDGLINKISFQINKKMMKGFTDGYRSAKENKELVMGRI